MTQSLQQQFSQPLLQWFSQHGRKDLPWQHPQTPYRVWVSEIMLQQTQVKTVIPYFEAFMQRFPAIETLAIASEDEVLAYWSGLGYYSRARNLHQTAQVIHQDYKGIFPSELEALMELPGIGPSTAAAIASLAFGKSTAILDGNVKRVLCRYFLVEGVPQKTSVHQTLWQLAHACMPKEQCAEYTQAIMDLGATCCTLKQPQCGSCPLQVTCKAKQANMVAHYPHKKASRSLPTKHQQFLLLHTTDTTIYLEKRPSPGLWGGLWCLPTIDKDACPIDFTTRTYHLETQSVQELMTFKHTFTHFHLHIKALSMQTIPRQSTKEAFYPGRWFTPDELSSLGLAKPVSRIIDHFLGNVAPWR